MWPDLRSVALVYVLAQVLTVIGAGIPSEGLQLASRVKRQTCYNRNNQCNNFKNLGYCTSRFYVTWMKQNCQLACGFCSSTPNSWNCRDNNRFCADWARKGECGRNPRYMHVNCKRSCRKCKVNGNWSAWGRWSTCSKSCNKGIRKRYRSCNKPSPQNGGKTCQGRNVQTQYCNSQPCKVDGQWSAWGAWSVCSKSCGMGIQKRYRSCNKPSPQNGGKTCPGINVQQMTCNNQPCPIDGGWSPWGKYSLCTASCGNTGEQIRMRACNNPRPQNGGKVCSGSMSQKMQCNRKPCPLPPIDGNWSPWSEWTLCSPECLRSRTRLCNNPEAQNGGRLCNGESLQMEECTGGGCKGKDKEKCGTRIKRGRIVGGTKVFPGEYPWQVGIKRIFQRKVFCGGSLINNEWVVTASHCVDGEDSEILQVVLGDVDQSTQDGQEVFVGVRTYFKHPKYNSANFDNDIAVIQLDQNVTFSKYIKPVCLPKATSPPATGTKCYVTGYGKIQEGGELSLSLRQAMLPVVNKDVCTEAYKDYQPLTEKMFCAGYSQGGIDSCQGDSGGPLVCQNEQERFYLAGVVSWGVGCARMKRYGVYADVAGLKSWVEEKIK